MYIYPSIGPDEWPGPRGPLHSKIIRLWVQQSLINVKMFEIANQSVEGGIYCSRSWAVRDLNASWGKM